MKSINKRFSVLINVTVSCIVGISAVAQVFGQPQREWIKFSAPGGGFVVLMPGAPTADVKTSHTASGDAVTHIFSFRNEQGFFGVVWTDYPAAMKVDKVVEFKAVRNNFMSAVDATLQGERKIDLNGVEGREFTADSQDVSFTSRVFISGNRTYQIAVGIPKVIDDRFAIAKFLASFQIVPAK